MANVCSLDGDLVRARLAELGHSQRSFAASLGYELRTLQRWLSGSRLDTADAERIARALGRGMRVVETPEAFDRDRRKPGSHLKWILGSTQV